MNCPKCHKSMRKLRWEITNNLKTGSEYKEYEKFTYECRDDDVWITTETPISKKPAGGASV